MIPNKKTINTLSIANFSNSSQYEGNKNSLPTNTISLWVADKKLQWKVAYSCTSYEKIEHFKLKEGTNYDFYDFNPVSPKICTLPKDWKLVYVIYNYGDNRDIYTNCELLARNNIIQCGEARFATFFIDKNNVLYAQSQNNWCYIYKVYYLI